MSKLLKYGDYIANHKQNDIAVPACNASLFSTNVFSIDEKNVDIIQLKAVQTGSAISPFYTMYIPDIVGLLIVEVLIAVVLYWLLFGPVLKMFAISDKIANQIK